MESSRREFFKSILPRTKSFREAVDDHPWTLGHLTVFPVQSKTKIKIKETQLIVESLPEGIRLRDEVSNKYFKLSLSSKGLLQAHLNEEWPETAVLSLFTGEIYTT